MTRKPIQPHGEPAVRDHAPDRPGAMPAGLARASDQDAIVRLAGDEATLARRVLENIPGVMVTVLDRDLRIVSIRASAEIAGVAGSDLLGRPLNELLPPDEVDNLHAHLEAVLDGEERSFVQERADLGRTFSVSAGPLLDGANSIVGVILTARDITAQAKAEARVATQLDRFMDAFEHAPMPMAVVNADATIRAVNAQLRDLIGRPASAVHGQPFASLLDPRDRERLMAAFEALESGATPRATVEVRLTLADEAPVSCTMQLTGRAANDPESGITVQIIDQTERNRHDAQLRYLTGHDALTGLVNRARFEEAIEAHLENCTRYGYDGSVVLINVDHFKQINDAHGHAIGDQQLIEVTGLLQRGKQESAIVARLGGDEFGVLLASGDLAAAMRVADNVLAAAHDHAGAARARGRVTFTLSIGVAACTPEVRGPADLLALAEHAVAAAKHGGRDRIAVPEVVDTTGPAAAHRRPQTAIGRLRRAIRDERFELHAQPITRLADDQVSQYELLVRMRDDDGELVPPGSFLPLAEHYGLIGEIDAWVTRRALDTLEEGPGDLCLQVNLSGRSLAHPALMDTITDGLRGQSGVADRLVFELTETAAIANVPQAAAFAERLTELGCSLALDDFGAGFASLHYLKHLPFAYLKIDGEFVANVSRNTTDQLIVAGILAITRGMDIRTVAEFVQDDACLEHLRGIGVDYAQGFHLGRPEPLERMLIDVTARSSRRRRA